jgi:uncharacterized protein (UPF0264 family)
MKERDQKSEVRRQMTKLLVSVRSAEEAKVALVGGADVIDVKEPRRGALGAAEPEVWLAVAAVVGTRAVTSVALGELLDEAVEVLASQAAEFAFAKVGLAGCGEFANWQERWRIVLERLPVGTLAVPVAYADWQAAKSPAVSDVLLLAATAPAKLLLIDTFDKSNGRLMDCLSREGLAEIAAMAAERDVELALAGSLLANDIAMLLELAPAYIGVRGAACRGGRDGAIDLARVKSLATIVSGENKIEASCCLTAARARQILPSR